MSCFNFDPCSEDLVKKTPTVDQYGSFSHFDPCSKYLVKERSTVDQCVSCSHFEPYSELLRGWVLCSGLNLGDHSYDKPGQSEFRLYQVRLGLLYTLNSPLM